jgi:hypothetical protein
LNNEDWQSLGNVDANDPIAGEVPGAVVVGGGVWWGEVEEEEEKGKGKEKEKEKKEREKEDEEDEDEKEEMEGVEMRVKGMKRGREEEEDDVDDDAPPAKKLAAMSLRG